MCDLLEQHWLSSTPSTRLKMLFVSLGWVCSEWDENKLVFSLFRTELWGKEQDWTSVIVRMSLWWTELNPLSFGRVTKIEKNCKKRSFFCGPKLFLPFLLICWTKTETQQTKKIVWTTKTEQNKKGKKKKLKHQSFVLWRGSETMIRLLLSCWCFAEFLAALCFIMLWRRGSCEVSTPILFQKRSLWLVSALSKSFVWLWTFFSYDKFLLLCFFSVWSGFSGWSSTPLCLSCFMSGFHELFRLLLMSSCCQVGSPCLLGSILELEGHQQFDEVLSVFLWWPRNQIIRTESTSICLVRKVLLTIKPNRWSFQPFFLYCVALCDLLSGVKFFCGFTGGDNHPELIEIPFFWWFTWSPSTTNCNHTRYSHLFTKKVSNWWFCRLVFAFFLLFLFLFFWMSGGFDWGHPMLKFKPSLMCLFWTTNNNFKKKRVHFLSNEKCQIRGSKSTTDISTQGSLKTLPIQNMIIPKPSPIKTAPNDILLEKTKMNLDLDFDGKRLQNVETVFLFRVRRTNLRNSPINPKVLALKNSFCPQLCE